VTERDPGWKASLDGVVSDFDEVTRHLRRRQGQVLRVAWSVVGATALAMGALIGLDLLPSGPGAGQAGSSAPLAQLQPGSSGTPTSSPLGGVALPLLPSPSPTASPSAPVTASAASAPHPHRHPSQVLAPVLAAVPVTPPAVLAPVTGSPSEPAQPSPAASSPSPSGGLLDGLVGGVVHGTG
jgi:hypothetical protein